MGILTEAKKQLEIEEQKRLEEEARWKSEHEYRAEAAKRSAIHFQTNQLDDVKLPLTVERNENKLTITKYGKKLVEITFNFDNKYIEYFEDFEPANSQSYQYIKAGRKSEFYTHGGYEGLKFLGEFLLIHQNKE